MQTVLVAARRVAFFVDEYRHCIKRTRQLDAEMHIMPAALPDNRLLEVRGARQVCISVRYFHLSCISGCSTRFHGRNISVRGGLGSCDVCIKWRSRARWRRLVCATSGCCRSCHNHSGGRGSRRCRVRVSLDAKTYDDDSI